MTLVSNFIDPSGRFLNSGVEIGDQRSQFCNVYAPNQVSNRSAFFNHLHPILKGGIPTVLTGDFNCVEDPLLDKIGGESDMAVSPLRSLQNLTQNYRLQDTFCEPQIRIGSVAELIVASINLVNILVFT